MLTPLSSVADADWYGARLGTVIGRVDGVIPAGYSAYARILHPASGEDGSAVKWADVAAWTGHTLHPLAQFHNLAGRRGHDHGPVPLGWPGEDPEQGSLDYQQLSVLRRLLADHTATKQDCVFAAWDGGGLPRQWRTFPRVVQPMREYYLFAGALEAVTQLSVLLFDLSMSGADNFSASPSWHGDPSIGPASEPLPPAPDRSPLVQSPHQWWPRDRAWCVATEIDFDSTLVAGSAALIGELVHHPQLEAFEVAENDDLTYRGDHVNPMPFPRGSDGSRLS